MDTESRIFDYYVELGSLNTPDLCVEKCSKMVKNGPPVTTNGFVFAGVQNGGQCLCGDRVPPRSIFTEKSECDMKCPGNERFNCGGSWRMNVYTTGLQQGYKGLDI